MMILFLHNYSRAHCIWLIELFRLVNWLTKRWSLRAIPHTAVTKNCQKVKLRNLKIIFCKREFSYLGNILPITVSFCVLPSDAAELRAVEL